MTCNPVLQFNKARTRAKGVWHSHGSVTLNRLGQLTSFWCLGKYDMEYVKERGQWKILKLVYRLTYMAQYEKGWAVESQGASITAAHVQSPLPTSPAPIICPIVRTGNHAFFSLRRRNRSTTERGRITPAGRSEEAARRIVGPLSLTSATTHRSSPTLQHL